MKRGLNIPHLCAKSGVIIDQGRGICNNAGNFSSPSIIIEVRLRPISILLLVLVSTVCLAGAIQPIDTLPDGIKTPAYAPGPLPFHPGQQLYYKVTWEQLPVAIARISLRRDPNHDREWMGEASVRTNKVVDVFYKLRSYLREEFPPQSLASDLVYIHHNENGRVTDYSVTFDRPDGRVETMRRKHDHTEIKRFAATHPLGPIGASLLAISQPMKVGKSMTLDVFAATERYVVKFEIVRREQIHVGADDLNAFRVIPTLLYVSNPKNHYKVTQAVVWVSDDERHVPLRIEADTFVGRIYIDLVNPADHTEEARAEADGVK
jgi:hypothetical protein